MTREENGLALLFHARGGAFLAFPTRSPESLLSSLAQKKSNVSVDSILPA